MASNYSKILYNDYEELLAKYEQEKKVANLVTKEKL
jgi:hypothetical protein